MECFKTFTWYSTRFGSAPDELYFHHFTVGSYSLFTLGLLSEIRTANLRHLVLNEIEILLQKPAHFSISRKIHTDLSMRALKRSGACNIAI